MLDRLQRLTAMRSQRRYLALLEDTVTLFHGPERLAATFLDEFEAAKRRGDHKTATKILMAIGGLCQWFDPLSKEEPDTSKPATSTGQRVGMSDQPEELDLSELSDAELKSRFEKLKKDE